jgi:hypothetical protein
LREARQREFRIFCHPGNVLVDSICDLVCGANQDWSADGIKPFRVPQLNASVEFGQLLMNQIVEPFDLFPFLPVVLHHLTEPINFLFQGLSRAFIRFEIPHFPGEEILTLSDFDVL